MGGGGRVEVISSKGCSRIFTEMSASVPSYRVNGLQSYGLKAMSPASSDSSVSELVFADRPQGPFSGLVICVTGLSKEARNQVMEATRKLGGEYSPNLHPHCTHLVVQSFRGPKFDHALKHGLKKGLSIVTLGWFVDSVKRNVRMSESLYRIRTVGETGMPTNEFKQLFGDADSEKSCIPLASREIITKCDIIDRQQLHDAEREPKRRNLRSRLSGFVFYIDPDVSAELKNKVVQAASTEGASLVEQWYVGCGATHVVCEGPSVSNYLGHSSNLVTPIWVLKCAKEKNLQRLVHISADLARQIAATADAIPSRTQEKAVNATESLQDAGGSVFGASLEERQKIARFAKEGVRKRRDRRMQTCQTPIRPITPNCLLDSLCWSLSEPASSASIYTDSSSIDDSNEQTATLFFDAKADGKESDALFVNLSRTLTESEKAELILKNHFLTILFPVDRFSEAGPCSRTFFSDNGFTCLQVLDLIYAFYQENMSSAEIEVAIHTDSRHADRLRSLYSSKDASEHGLQFKRIDFLGSRRSFEMLKRVSGDNNSNVYELILRA